MKPAVRWILPLLIKKEEEKEEATLHKRWARHVLAQQLKVRQRNNSQAGKMLDAKMQKTNAKKLKLIQGFSIC